MANLVCQVCGEKFLEVNEKNNIEIKRIEFMCHSCKSVMEFMDITINRNATLYRVIVQNKLGRFRTVGGKDND